MKTRMDVRRKETAKNMQSGAETSYVNTDPSQYPPPLMEPHLGRVTLGVLMVYTGFCTEDRRLAPVTPSPGVPHSPPNLTGGGRCVMHFPQH